MEKNPYEIDFEEYIREGEPDKKEKSIAWSIATGLQQVDGLTPSAYLYETAKRNIEGEISIEEARKLIDSYYESKTDRAEADKVSARIVQILRDKTFNFSPEEAVKHFTRFIANLWQIHAFGEGNTRTTAVFAIKYLRKLGYATDNTVFEKNSWYFRNALVRANYSNGSKGIYMNTEYLERFFRNIMLGENNELKNRYTHIDYDEYMKKFGENEKTSVQNTENFGVNEKTSVQIIEIMKNTPNITLQEIAEKLNRSKRAVEMQVKKLREQGIIKRIGADKNGHWEVIG